MYYREFLFLQNFLLEIQLFVVIHIRILESLRDGEMAQ